MEISVSKLTRGAVIRKNEFIWEKNGPFSLAHPIRKELGSINITGVVVDIPRGEIWRCCEMAKNQEVIVVIFSGGGKATIGDVSQTVEKHASLYAPTGLAYSIEATEDTRIYIWQSDLLQGSTTSISPRHFNHLFNNETIFEGFMGTDPTQTNNAPANMNFLFWPGTGCAHLSLHCGIQEPGQNFGVHSHPISEELFIGVEGKGQVHLDGKWIDFEEGDILYSPENIYHGTRNPDQGPNAKRFVTCGGPVPFDVNFYTLAGLSPEVK
ncbi:cupin domain-containing protein [Bacillus sp. NEB1478]|uniref:cupin domain-containing protein n=1 Tax=Bacillus sp. NEB1478 TaxID=3073816 RepID=UPI002873C200|nr:cupin domain-containing protein [Bacillus sp. NEB1478]WNB92531.1 cupin domain-containing protein [Bacillus sp. NEB1478]